MINMANLSTSCDAFCLICREIFYVIAKDYQYLLMAKVLTIILTVLHQLTITRLELKLQLHFQKLA